MTYNFLDIEERCQRQWETERINATPNPGDEDFDPSKPRFYILDMFPYPSGVGLHVGHPLGYIATDILARYKRMRGYNVLHPMGYDAFGLPAENFAVEHGVHPSITTKQNIDTIYRQLKRLGLSYDWDRVLSTTDPEFYRWTQWIFLQMYNSWFDPIENRARPITELVGSLDRKELILEENGKLSRVDEAPKEGVISWATLTEEQKTFALNTKRLAYLDEVAVNWCPQLGTVLANEEVTNEGRSDRGNYPVYRRPLRQWMLRITAYSDRLSEELELVAWPDSIKTMQRNWIGKSEGAYVNFLVATDTAEAEAPIIRVFTTRPDTLFGATYLVLAPEHPLVDTITTDERRHEVNAYRQNFRSKLAVGRAELEMKSGVFSGSYAVNPVNNAKIPIWIADYVLMEYGSGAIMSVPAHDERDFLFAKQFDLPIIPVVTPTDHFLNSSQSTSVQHNQDLLTAFLHQPASFSQPFTGEGITISSSHNDLQLDGLSTREAKERVVKWLQENQLGQGAVQYKLRDWLFSRQRYWGEPFPILHGPNGQILPVGEQKLPVTLPPMSDFTPTASDDPNAPPVAPLSRAPDTWKFMEQDGVRYTRETNTMPQWAGSCWYYLRFIEPHNDARFVSPEAERYWMSPNVENRSGGVDLYVGGAEHAVLHLLYARFWHKVLFDLGHVSTPEPFGRLFNQGYILAYSYQDARGMYVPADDVEEQEGRYFYQGKEVTRRLGKMGKSLKNAVSPDEIIKKYGADTLRLYEMYLGPLDQSKPWRTQDIVGVHRFLHRVWRLLIPTNTGSLLLSEQNVPAKLEQLTHKIIKRTTEAMEVMAFNVAIAALIEFTNELVKTCPENGENGSIPRQTAETLLILLSPLAPHVSQELWQLAGHVTQISKQPWPEFSSELIADEEIDYAVQVNGRLRQVVRVSAGADEKQVENILRADPKVAGWLAGRHVKKVIIVRNKLVNFVLDED